MKDTVKTKHGIYYGILWYTFLSRDFNIHKLCLYLQVLSITEFLG